MAPHVRVPILVVGETKSGMSYIYEETEKAKEAIMT
jgi:hypothetical protein